MTPNTRPIFAALEPTTLPKAKSGLPERAAFRLTTSSGKEVAKETTVIPTIIFGIDSLSEIETDDLSKAFPPKIRRTNPPSNKRICIIAQR